MSTYSIKKKSVTKKERDQVIVFFHVPQNFIILGNEMVIY